MTQPSLCVKKLIYFIDFENLLTKKEIFIVRKIHAAIQSLTRSRWSFRRVIVELSHRVSARLWNHRRCYQTKVFVNEKIILNY